MRLFIGSITDEEEYDEILYQFLSKKSDRVSSLETMKKSHRGVKEKNYKGINYLYKYNKEGCIHYYKFISCDLSPEKVVYEIALEEKGKDYADKWLKKIRMDKQRREDLKKINDKIEELGLKKKKLAEKLGITDVYMSYMLNDRKIITPKMKKKIFEILDIE